MDNKTVSYKRYQRAVSAREEAEKLLEEKSIELYNKNEELKLLTDSLEEEVKQRTSSLEIAVKKAEHANKAKSEFLANMSHELRTPMHGILSFSSFGIDIVSEFEESKPNKKLAKYFNRIHVSGKRLMTLLNDLLDLAKLESGKMDVSFKLANLESIVKDCVLEQEARLQENQIAISYVEGNCPGQVLCDEAKIGQVITNFLSNAIKFTPSHQTIDLVIKESKLTINNEMTAAVLFSMRDHGKGIPDEELKIVFEKFTQSSYTTIATTKGTGLGLPISKEIIELHQGKVWAENHQSGGAIFSFIIPVSQSNQQAKIC